MIDDNLNDTQPLKGVGTKEQLKTDTNQLGKFNTKLSSYKLIWNEAIEAAASEIDKCNKEGPYQAIVGADRIRKLKK